ncbi:MAG: hypothetical protein FJ118_03630 [Deltaproteobacteria bacterium]|nr:hypothetical protein [Deltaproteobacteria bacterium]
MRALFTMCLCCLPAIVSSPQVMAQAPSQEEAGPPARPGSDQPAVTEVGSSGFKVVIPEVKMKQILRARPAPRPEEPRPEGFDERAPEPKKEEPIPTATHTPERESAQTKERLEVDAKPPTTQEAPSKPRGVFPFPTPKAPEDLIEIRPLRKEVLREGPRPSQAPELAEVQPSKAAIPPASLEAAKAPDAAEASTVIPFAHRREMAIIPGPPPTPAQRTVRAREEIPDRRPSSEPGPVEERPTPEAQAPEPAQIPERPAPLEKAPSPLDIAARDQPEAKEYLQATAPILEELSLLITRVPSLKIEDYDPSEAGSGVVPKDILLKMDSVKRDLQILDSKTFAIIPPPQYSLFHSMIRESITHTHHACNDIMAFFNDAEPESLTAVQGHLLKAKELIQRARQTG